MSFAGTSRLNMSVLERARGGARALRHVRFAWERFVASARAGSWAGRLRRRARFVARAVDQDGVLLLMPREPSLAFAYVPLLILSAACGAALAMLG